MKYNSRQVSNSYMFLQPNAILKSKGIQAQYANVHTDHSHWYN